MTPDPQIAPPALETLPSEHQNKLHSSLPGSGYWHWPLTLLVLTLSFSGSPLFGQVVPAIIDVTPIDTYPNNVGFPTVPGKVLITGSGFSNSAADLQVWFDQVAGEIVSASDFAIEVKVPPQARLSNVTVVNKASKLSAKSKVKFVPTFNGADFDATRLAPPVSHAATSELFDVCTCDLDVDGKPDVIGTRNNPNDLALTVLRNTNTVGSIVAGGFVTGSIAMGSPTFNVACGDLNGDGKPEVVASRGGNNRNQIIVRVNNSTTGTLNFTTIPNLNLDVSHIAFRIVIRDMNLDGKPDIIASNAFQTSGTVFNTIYIFKNTSTFGVTSIDPAPFKITVSEAFSSYGIDAQDLDGDELPDLVLNQFNGNTVFTIKNTSTVSQMSFAASKKHVIAGTPAPQLIELGTGDYNEDGSLDVVVTDAFGNKAFVLLNDPSASTITFRTPMELTTGAFPWGVESSDVDGDGDVDIVVASRGLGSTAITLFKNNGNNSSLAFTAVSVTTGKKSRNLRVSDIDGDGKPDISYTTDGSVNGTCVGNDCSWDVIRNLNCFVPRIINDSPLTVCPAQTIQLKSIPGIGVTNYSWSKDGAPGVSSGASPFSDVTGSGVYTVTAVSEGGSCLRASTTFTVGSGAGTLPAAPTITNSNPTFVCVGANLQLTAATVAGATYAWEGPNGFTSALQNPLVNNITVDNAGFYSLVLSNGTCSTNPATVRIDVASLGSFAVTSTVPSNQVCQGGPTLDLATSLVPNHSYQWIKDGADISGATASTLTAVNQQGAYQVRVTNDTYLCSAVTTPAVNVVVLTPPVAAFTIPAKGCASVAVTFTDQSQKDERATASYNWNFGDAGTSTEVSPVHTYTTAQTFNPSLTVSYAGVLGCSSTVSKSIVVTTTILPVIAVTPAAATDKCPGETANLSVASTFPTITWSTAATTASIDVIAPGTYVVNTLDVNGCAGTDDQVIVDKAVPDLTVTASDTVINIGLSTTLNASSTTAGTISYVWSPPEFLDNPNVAAPVATPDTTTVFTVAATLAGECTATKMIRIRVVYEALPVPNVFTPNGDTFNDYWVIPGIESFPECTIALYDKQGRRVFEKLGYQNDPGWDGTFDGRSVPPGTYYFVFSCPDKEPQTGHVLVAR
jgi:gliding motility-associated-like protein